MKKIITLMFVLLSLASYAKEVNSSQVNPDKKIINLLSYSSIKEASDNIKKLPSEYEILTLKGNDYNQYLVNIDANSFESVLIEVKKIIPDAKESKKINFATEGVFLLSFDADDEVFSDTTKLKEVKQSYESIAISDEINDKNISNDLDAKEFQKVDLIDVVLQTISASHKVKASREKMIQAKGDIDIAYANYYPSVDASYTLTKTQLDADDKKNGLSIYDSKYYRDEVYSLKLSQNIYAGGETKNNVEKLRALYLLSKVEYTKILESEIKNAIISYVDVLFSRESLEASDSNIKELEKIFTIVKARYDAGALSVGELSNIEASISNAKTQSSKTNSIYMNALEYFEYIVGESFEDKYPHEKIIEIKLKDFDTMLESALQKNSTLRAIDYKILSNKYNLQKIKAAFKPTVDFVAGAEKMTYKENVEENQERFYAKVLLNYNLYNGGRDEKRYLNAFSEIKEKIYDKKSEVRRIKWGLEKFHTSLTSLQDNMNNSLKEVEASKSMVDSYWESFRNGQQDLYVLLEAQRQLNSAQLSYIQNQQNSMKDYFEILSLSGELLDYFYIDIESENYLNLAKSNYRINYTKAKEKTEYVIMDNNLSIVDKNTTLVYKQEDQKNVESFEKEIIDEKTMLDGILSFHENFLLEDSDSYTIVISKFDNSINALKMIDKLKIQENSFIYQFYKDKKIQTNIAYGIYKSKEEAKLSLEQLELPSDKKAKIESIKIVQKSFDDFAKLMFVDIKELEKYKKLLAEKEMVFQTDKAFKERFLLAPQDSFTINITTLSSMQTAGKILEDAKIEKESFVFYFGEDKKWIKLMMGVYPTYEDASKALDSLGDIKTEYMPVIEKISSKQKLYRKFNK
nr:TolC family protein [uncultured Sulfurimonas sp.]